MIYFIGDRQFVKIGYAKSVAGRVADLQCANPRPLSLLASCNGDRSLEYTLHRAIEGRVRRNGEWFNNGPTLRALISDINERGDVAVKEFVQAKRKARADKKIDFVASDAKLTAAIAAVFTRLNEECGAADLAVKLRCSPQSTRLYASGKVVPSSIRLTHLFQSYPETFAEIFGAKLGSIGDADFHQEAQTELVLRDLKEAQAAITSLIMQAERIAA